MRSTLKAPDVIMTEIIRALKLSRVPFKQTSPSNVRCDRKGLRFDLHVLPPDQVESSYVVKIQQAAGEVGPYRDLCSRVLAEMQL